MKVFSPEDLTLSPWNASEGLEDPAEAAAYLSYVLREEPDLLPAALTAVAKAQGVTGGPPAENVAADLTNLMQAVRALGLDLDVTPHRSAA